MSGYAHDHEKCVRDALNSAQRLCGERGVRLTPLRKRVLELVWQSHEAIKAYALLDKLGGAGASAKPPTVYRALEFLLAQGLIHRIESDNAYTGCRHPETPHECQLLICDDCHHVEEVTITSVSDTLRQQAGKHGFRVNRQMVEIHGQCPACAGS